MRPPRTGHRTFIDSWGRRIDHGRRGALVPRLLGGVFATDAALGSHLAVCVGRAGLKQSGRRPGPRTTWTAPAACSATSAASAC